MEQTIYIHGYGRREDRQHTQLVLTDIQAVTLIRLLAEALELIAESDSPIRVTLNHSRVLEGINIDAVEATEDRGVIVDAPRLK